MIEPKQNVKTPVEPPQGLGIKPADIYYMIFRRKWLILGFLAVGLVAGVAVFFTQRALYWSEAKLLVRYVLEAKSMEAGGGTQVKTLDYGGEAIINSELEILTSLDLCEEVANLVGPDKILGSKGSNATAAAISLYKGLSVENPRRSNIIKVRFVHPDPAVCQVVLRQLIDSYFKRHIAIHRDGGAYDEVYSTEVNKLRLRIQDYEKKLHDLKAQAGVVSVEDAQKNLSAQLSRLRGDLFETQAKLAEIRVLVGLAPSASAATNANDTNVVAGIPAEKISEYKLVCGRLDAARANEFDMLAQYTDENPLVKRIRERIAENDARKKDLEAEYPRLAALYVPQVAIVPAKDDRPDPAQIPALETKINVLTNQIALVRNDIAVLDKLETQIADVERNLQIDKQNYVHMATTLAAQGFSEALGSGKLSNIQSVQAPSPPVLNVSARLKVVAGTFFGFFIAGLGLAFLLERVVDHTVRRPSDIENKLRMPLFLSIPELKLNGHVRLLPLPSDVSDSPQTNGGAALNGTWAAEHPLRPYIDGLRDRTLIHFDGDPHKPKLIGVTGCASGAGVTSLAAGLAGALSETGDGNVLLLNLNFQSQSVHPFYRGELTCDISDALELDKRRNSPVLQNLYVATAGSSADAEAQNLSRQLARVVPKLRVSDYDYIVFDLPPTTPTTMTARLAGMMDLVILVVESEKDTHESVKEVGKLLSRSKARVSAVLNKVTNPVPQWLHKAV